MSGYNGYTDTPSDDPFGNGGTDALGAYGQTATATPASSTASGNSASGGFFQRLMGSLGNQLGIGATNGGVAGTAGVNGQGLPYGNKLSNMMLGLGQGLTANAGWHEGMAPGLAKGIGDGFQDAVKMDSETAPNAQAAFVSDATKTSAQQNLLSQLKAGLNPAFWSTSAGKQVGAQLLAQQAASAPAAQASAVQAAAPAATSNATAAAQVAAATQAARTRQMTGATGSASNPYAWAGGQQYGNWSMGG